MTTTDEQQPSTYITPAHGWTCFHCGETFPGNFAGSRRARDHFGHDPLSDPACRIKAGEERGLLMALRRAEATIKEQAIELARYRIEDSDKDRLIHGLIVDHQVALRREEEKGYARGLADGMAEKATKA